MSLLPGGTQKTGHFYDPPLLCGQDHGPPGKHGPRGAGGVGQNSGSQESLMPDCRLKPASASSGAPWNLLPLSESWSLIYKSRL